MTTQIVVLLALPGTPRKYIALTRIAAAILTPPTGTLINFGGGTAEVYEVRLGFGDDGQLIAGVHAMYEFDSPELAEAAAMQSEVQGWTVKRPT